MEFSDFLIDNQDLVGFPTEKGRGTKKKYDMLNVIRLLNADKITDRNGMIYQNKRIRWFTKNKDSGWNTWDKEKEESEISLVFFIDEKENRLFFMDQAMIDAFEIKKPRKEKENRTISENELIEIGAWQIKNILDMDRTICEEIKRICS